jgi:hypothetical protein
VKYVTIYKYYVERDESEQLCRLYEDGSVDGEHPYADAVRDFVTSMEDDGHSIQSHWEYISNVFMEKYNNGYLFCTEDEE